MLSAYKLIENDPTVKPILVIVCIAVASKSEEGLKIICRVLPCFYRHHSCSCLELNKILSEMQ